MQGVYSIPTTDHPSRDTNQYSGIGGALPPPPPLHHIASINSLNIQRYLTNNLGEMYQITKMG
jgi:hypothetical protein